MNNQINKKYIYVLSAVVFLFLYSFTKDPNLVNSKFEGVQVGVITYSYRSMPGKTLDDVLHYVVESGISSVELMGGAVEEYAGIPKGERSTYHTIAENKQFAQEANNFAQKYGYPKIVYDPSNITTEQLNSQVKSMLDRHNTFLRGTVPESPFIEDTEQAIKALGQNYTPEQYQIYAATHPRTWGEEALEPAIFVGDQNAHIYGNGKAAAVQYPYKLGKDRSKWLIEGDTPIYYSNGLTAQERINKGFRGIISPWEFKQEGISSGGTNELMTVSDIPLIFKGWSTPEKPYPIRIPMKANKLFETLQ